MENVRTGSRTVQVVCAGLGGGDGAESRRPFNVCRGGAVTVERPWPNTRISIAVGSDSSTAVVARPKH